MSELINRSQYLDQLIQNKDADLVKIVTGIRRCGKSSLPDLFHRYLSENSKESFYKENRSKKPYAKCFVECNACSRL